MSIRHILAAAAITTLAAPAFAGGLADPIVEPIIDMETVIDDASQNPSIGATALVLLSTLIVVGAAVSN
ncbi:hypothetical protein VK792_07415 [Mesobacterium sp. TK19101]|uniref:Ferrochelatase n=1 Tax=Mesobacterium hydrothermale TaxID=3111907 RepID=A0ABU6HF56_9RHOB|nr:hypothetical protein [Mesobacterium sp. TK19101]MEC3861107.1 hypothetical protein [Mesobacterium sp. TK19101]